MSVGKIPSNFGLNCLGQQLILMTTILDSIHTRQQVRYIEPLVAPYSSNPLIAVDPLMQIGFQSFFLGNQSRLIGSQLSWDPSTRVIASITPSWREKVEHAIPQWVMASFDDRVISLKPLDSRPENALIAIEWFIWKASRTRADEVYMSSEAKDLLVNHSWPGNYEELGKAVSLLAEAIDVGEVDTIDVCRRVIASSKTSGDGAVDRNRWEECRNCVSGLSYVGRPIEPHEVYQWASQFSKVSSDRRIDPWLPSLIIAKEMAHRYYYSADRIRALIRDAYRSLCDELAAKGYIADSLLTGTNDSFPRLQAALVNPLGPFKSSSGILPHLAHLLRNGPKQKILSIDEVAQFLSRNDTCR